MGVIYLDSCLLIYLFEQHPVYGPRVHKAMSREPAERFTISPLVKFECLVAPMRDGNLVLQRYYETGLAQLTLLPMPEAVFIQAAQLRAHFSLKTPDALHLAAAQHHGCTEFWTNDERLKKAAHGMARNICK